MTDGFDPLGDCYGLDRGTPLDRYYIQAFLAENQESIQGQVLEVGDSRYTVSFGGDRVQTSEVIDIDSTNSNATLITDLCKPGSLPSSTYDCIILTQTLHLLREPGICLENCLQGPRGVLLLTAPALSRLSPTYPDGDFWRFTVTGMSELFGKHWDGPFNVDAYGNLPICIGFLHGEVVEETPDEVLRRRDPRFPLTVAVQARRHSRADRAADG